MQPAAGSRLASYSDWLRIWTREPCGWQSPRRTVPVQVVKFYEYTSPIAHTPLVADWKTAYSSGLQPSATVGAALFPAISGEEGVRLRCNFGLDPGRPLRFPPSKPEGAQHEQVLLSWTCI
jgi:hypothetical protein